MLFIDKDEAQISVRRQCELLGISRSGLYYKPRALDELTIMLMHRLDELYTEHPYYGVRRMTACLNREGHFVNVKRIRRLLRIMGLCAIYPGQNLSRRNKEHIIYPYLLRGLDVNKNDHVWSSDITYIRLKKGFVYLTAIIDWYSRYVLSWQISDTLEADFCIESLERALRSSKPDIFNTDQGSQFTTPRFTRLLLDKDVQISMDGRGRALDNIFVERLWRSVKQEKIYIEEFRTIKEVNSGIKNYFDF